MTQLPFRDYLDIKFDLDGRSLNRDVQAAFNKELMARREWSILDVGAGNGANLRRLINLHFPGILKVTAVDIDPELLEQAHRQLSLTLALKGFDLKTDQNLIQARRKKERIRIEFLETDLKQYTPKIGKHFDVILAHAVLDLLPARKMIRRMSRWLKPGGMLYSTLNYDGGTWLFPAYRDESLEEKILKIYDDSMEQRTMWGLPIAGAHSGRRLHAECLKAGLDMISLGSSDWNLVPHYGSYRGLEKFCLEYLLGLIHKEAVASKQFSPVKLADWYKDRRLALASARLGLVCHQLDLLCSKPEA